MLICFLLTCTVSDKQSSSSLSLFLCTKPFFFFFCFILGFFSLILGFSNQFWCPLWCMCVCMWVRAHACKCTYVFTLFGVCWDSYLYIYSFVWIWNFRWQYLFIYFFLFPFLGLHLNICYLTLWSSTHMFLPPTEPSHKPFP